MLYRPLTSAGSYSSGSYSVIEEGTADLLYDEPLLEVPFPLTYGMDRWEGSTSYSTEVEVEGETFMQSKEIELTGEVTGWGTLLLPGMDPLDVLRIE